jgi:hypothetical protein
MSVTTVGGGRKKVKKPRSFKKRDIKEGNYYFNIL